MSRSARIFPAFGQDARSLPFLGTTGTTPAKPFRQARVVSLLMLLAALTSYAPEATATAAQASGPRIEGTVTDPTGATVAGAKVSFVQTGGRLFEAITDARGHYHIAIPAPGTYTVTTEANGFSKATTRITVVAGETAKADVQLVLSGLSQEVVVTDTGDFGSKSGIALALVPQSVQVLDEADIMDRGARTVEDALQAVPSATVSRSRVGGFGGSTLRVRGLAAQQMRNGIPQRWYDSIDPSAMSNIGRMEVLKGPSGVLYGQGGDGGIVSIITKQPTEAITGSVALTVGSFDQKLVTIDVGGPITNTFGFRLTGETERSGSFVDYLDVDRENFGVTLAWRPNNWAFAHFVAESLHRKTLNNPGLPTVGT